MLPHEGNMLICSKLSKLKKRVMMMEFLILQLQLSAYLYKV